MFSCCFGGGSSTHNQGNEHEPRREGHAGGESIINVYTPEVNPGVPVTVQHAKFLAMLDAMEEANHPPPAPDNFVKQQPGGMNVMNSSTNGNPSSNSGNGMGMGSSKSTFNNNTNTNNMINSTNNNHNSSQDNTSLHSTQRDGSRGSSSPMALSASKTSLKSHNKNSARTSPKASIAMTQQKSERNHVYISPEAPS